MGKPIRELAWGTTFKLGCPSSTPSIIYTNTSFLSDTHLGLFFKGLSKGHCLNDIPNHQKKKKKKCTYEYPSVYGGKFLFTNFNQTMPTKKMEIFIVVLLEQASQNSGDWSTRNFRSKDF
jgi:hypothetical protein